MTEPTRIGGNARFSAISIHGSTAYLAGQVSQLKDGDITAQCHDVFAKIDALLDQAGSDRSHVLSAQIWLKDMADYAGMNEVWDSWINPESPPVRACVQSPMAQSHYLVEIMVITAIR